MSMNQPTPARSEDALYEPSPNEVAAASAWLHRYLKECGKRVWSHDVAGAGMHAGHSHSAVWQAVWQAARAKTIKMQSRSNNCNAWLSLPKQTEQCDRQC